MRTAIGLWRLGAISAVAAALVACGGDDAATGDGGTAGAAGSSGASGASGSGGSSGSSGQGGSSGAAGAGAQGGSAGSAGSGAQAGSAGAAGSGAQGGSAGAAGSGAQGGSAGAAGSGAQGGSAGAAGSGAQGGSAGAAGGGAMGGSAGAAGSGAQGGSAGAAGAGAMGGSAGAAGAGAMGGSAGAAGSGAQGGSAGAAGSGAQGGSSGQGGGGPLGGPLGMGGSAGSAGAGGGTICNSGPNDDSDMDGFTVAQGDCNDCDPNVNPGAQDVINTDMAGQPLPDNAQIDEDCSGSAALPSDPTTCDTGLGLTSNDPADAAKAMDMCNTSMNGSWGIVSVNYVEMDGSTPMASMNFNRGHGILPNFGPNVSTENGANLLALSSGTGRRPGDTGYDAPSNNGSVGGFSKGYTTGNPSGFPFPASGCNNNPMAGSLRDSIGLQVQLKVPTNAQSLSFKFKFYTAEFPSFVCSQFNDVFIAKMDPPPMGAAPPNTGNISFDSSNQPLSVNNAFLDVCTAQTAGGKMFSCTAGTDQLNGNGFAGHGGTSWLTTTAPVTPGSTITLTFAIADAGDGVLDSTVLLDDFKFSSNPGTVQTKSCNAGGDEYHAQCSQCISAEASVGGNGCCATQFADCLANGSCNSILLCAGSCNGNQTCIDQCKAMFSAGASQYTAYDECMFGVDGDASQVGACGTICNAP